MADSLSDISCENCVAACCRAPINMTLSAVEFKRNKKTMDLREVAKPKLYPQRIEIPARAAEDGTPQTRFVETPGGYGLYELETGCANLDKHYRCGIYQTRPACCREFELHSPMCLLLRREAGLDADLPEYVAPSPAEIDAPTPLDRLRAQIFPSFATAPTPEPSTPQVANAAVRADPLDFDAVVAVIARETRSITKRIAAFDSAQWATQSRCEGWDVAAIVNHLVNAHRFTAEIIIAAEAGHDVEQDATIEVEYAANDLVSAFMGAEQRLAALLADFAPTMYLRNVNIVGDNATLRHVLHVLAFELAVHGADIAHAFGAAHRFSPDAVKSIAAVLPRLFDAGVTPTPGSAYVLASEAFELPLTWRDEAWHLEPGADPCWIEGAAENVLLFALGRQSFDASQLRSNDESLARQFKQYLTGP